MGSVISSIFGGHKHNVPVYNAEAQKKKVAEKEAEANKKRVLEETDTIRTTALGESGNTEVKKKTLLGG